MKWFCQIAFSFCLAFALVCFSVTLIFAQQPSHFLIGQIRFANSHIYSLLHHSDNLLYVSTNEGLFVYRNGKFQAIEASPQQQGGALFSLIENEKGALFCADLSGQIFRLSEDRLELVDRVPAKFLGDGVSLVFDKNDALIVRSNGLLKLDATGWKRIYFASTEFSVSLNGFDPNGILTSNNINTDIIRLRNNVIDTVGVSRIFDAAVPSQYYSARLNNAYVSLHGLGNFFNHTTKVTSHHTGFNVREFVQLGENEVWALDQTAGIQRIFVSNNAITVSEAIFKDRFISCIVKSDNGTIYLGTFNHGIIVIPNIESRLTIFKDRYLSGICASPKGVMAIENSGSIYDISDKGIQLYKKNAAYERGGILSFPGVDFGIDRDRSFMLYDYRAGQRKTLISGLKDGTRVNANTVIIATNRGIFRMGSGADHIKWIQKYTSGKWVRFSSSEFRSKAVAYNTETQGLYYTRSKELVFVDGNGNESVVQYDGKDIACNRLLYEKGAVWCASQQFGVLQLKNGKMVQRLGVENGLGNNYVHQVQYHQEKLFISHRSGFQIYDRKTKIWRSIGAAEGLINGSASEFVIANNKLWVLSQGKLISFPLNQKEKKPDFKLDISSVRLGQTPLYRSQASVHPHTENHLLVALAFRGIEFGSEAVIQYRLFGLSEDWKSVPSATTEIELNTLPPNNYDLQVRVKYRSIEAELQTFPFQINPPFHQTLLFYILIVIGSMLLIIAIFKVYNKRTQRKQKALLDTQKLQTDLFESELKALRSQMNPHFIFNSLNSIQALVLKEDTENSYDYIALFAKLVRNTLNYSNQDFIPIEKELEFLEVYLSLEKLRFGKAFEYTISYHGGKNINVPSLLVQPFIENALIHGLLHKTGIKKLSVNFNYNEKLTCTIIDNGVGRARAKEILERRGGKHESFAMAAIEQRLDILNKQFGKEVGSYIITDLFEDEKPIGTKVELIIPIRTQY